MLVSSAILGVVALGLPTPVSAPEKFAASCENFGYVGGVTVYANFSDAIAGKNPVRGPIPFPQRDGSLYFVRNNPEVYEDFNGILTNWYATTDPDPEKKGYGNPNNKNEGFFQLYDHDANTWNNRKAYWSKDLHTFTVEAKGDRANYPSPENPGDYARLWNAGVTPTAGEGTKGTFVRYEYKFVATGLNAQDKGNGYYEAAHNATGYSGTFRAVFRNESERYPGSNGFYVVELSFNNVSWAKANGLTERDLFGSNDVRK